MITRFNFFHLTVRYPPWEITSVLSRTHRFKEPLHENTLLNNHDLAEIKNHPTLDLLKIDSPSSRQFHSARDAATTISLRSQSKNILTNSFCAQTQPKYWSSDLTSPTAEPKNLRFKILIKQSHGLRFTHQPSNLFVSKQT